MSDILKDGGPAFPHAAVLNASGTPWDYGEDGMSLRDWLAGQALASGMMLNAPAEDLPEIAMWCYRAADAMLAAREVRP